ncbi:MAG: c-type cytochrome [Armatimonadota bacterium]
MFVTRNLTSDPQTGLGSWTEDAIVRAIRNGRAPDRVLNLWGMPWMYLHSLREDDARAIARYLKSLPPVRNAIPAALHYGIVETLVAKLTRPLPAVPVTVLTYAEGNFGQTGAGPSRDLVQLIFIVAQWLVFIAGVIVFLRSPGAERATLTRRRRKGVLALIAAFGLLILGLIGWAVYALPALRIIPPEQIADAVTGSIPRLDRAEFAPPEQRALAERGRYLFTVASCAFCHGNDGAGGSKISWTAFGTLWVRNITPDEPTGIGRWSEADIARAIRSGVTPDGRALHWQGMI